MTKDRTYISKGDFIDLKHKIRQKGISYLVSHVKISSRGRIISKWNQTTFSGSDFWVIPQVKLRWNEKCTGNRDIEYEDYVVQKYLQGRNDLRMLSVGCGTGARERKLGKCPCFSLIEGVDLAAKQIAEARVEANKQNLSNLQYHVGDFKTIDLLRTSYDVILFNSSLHHFDKVEDLLRENVLPLLKEEGLLIIFEFTGPNRLQWSKEQLFFANNLLSKIPAKYRTRYNTTITKNKIYRPGWLRMLSVDPSEAIDSESILPSLHEHFEVLEERQVGWNILHILLKDISHNFLDQTEETQDLLKYLFEEEDIFIQRSGRSDFTFGVYRKGSATSNKIIHSQSTER